MHPGKALDVDYAFHITNTFVSGRLLSSAFDFHALDTESDFVKRLYQDYVMVTIKSLIIK